jgi:hypothetical protein
MVLRFMEGSVPLESRFAVIGEVDAGAGLGGCGGDEAGGDAEMLCIFGDASVRPTCRSIAISNLLPNRWVLPRARWSRTWGRQQRLRRALLRISHEASAAWSLGRLLGWPTGPVFRRVRPLKLTAAQLRRVFGERLVLLAFSSSFLAIIIGIQPVLLELDAAASDPSGGVHDRHYVGKVHRAGPQPDGRFSQLLSGVVINGGERREVVNDVRDP